MENLNNIVKDIMSKQLRKEFFHAMLFATCIGLPFVLYFAFVMTP